MFAVKAGLGFIGMDYYAQTSVFSISLPFAFKDVLGDAIGAGVSII